MVLLSYYYILQPNYRHRALERSKLKYMFFICVRTELVHNCYLFEYLSIIIFQFFLKIIVLIIIIIIIYPPPLSKEDDGTGLNIVEVI